MRKAIWLSLMTCALLLVAQNSLIGKKVYVLNTETGFYVSGTLTEYEAGNYCKVQNDEEGEVVRFWYDRMMVIPSEDQARFQLELEKVQKQIAQIVTAEQREKEEFLRATEQESIVRVSGQLVAADKSMVAGRTVFLKNNLRQITFAHDPERISLKADVPQAVTDAEGRFRIDVDPDKEKIALQTAYQVVVFIAKPFSTDNQMRMLECHAFNISRLAANGVIDVDRIRVSIPLGWTIVDPQR